MARVFKEKRSNGTLKLVGFVLGAVVVLAIVWWGVASLDDSSTEKQLQIAEKAIVRATVQCYALEAQYPPTLDYLVENYGLVVDKKKFVYHYYVTGTNMMPDIRVFENTEN
jgi:hypothetical protein